ncbi:MAG: hypothetical protein U0J70_11865, partial [Atopobiaceae bacterium]|nr:hypothetical protein [Atopobiaceae bacterium]
IWPLAPTVAVHAPLPSSVSMSFSSFVRMTSYTNHTTSRRTERFDVVCFVEMLFGLAPATIAARP